MAQKTAAPFRTQVGKGFGRLDWPRSPPPPLTHTHTSPLSFPRHHHQRTGPRGGGVWSTGRSWHCLGHAYCFYRPALAFLPGVAPSLPLLFHFLLHEKPAMSQDTCFLLLGTLPILLGIKRPYSSSQDGGLHHARNMFRNLWRSEKGFWDETKGNSVVGAGSSSGWS